MHYLETPLYSSEFVFVLVYFSDLFWIKSNRRNCTPKQQQWVANFSVTTNILLYLTVQIESIFLLIFEYLIFNQSQRGAETISLLVSWPKRFPSASLANAFMTYCSMRCPGLFWSMGMVLIPLCKPKARFVNTVGYPVWDFCRTEVSKANMGLSHDGHA